MVAKIFIAEDSADDQRIFARALGRDFSLVFSDGSDRPVERMLSADPDLIILDLMFPRTNGLRLMEDIREVKALRDVPVFFVTASREVGARLQGLRQGAHDFLMKPFHPTELRVRGRNCLRLSSRELTRGGTCLAAGDLRLDLDKLSAYVESGTAVQPLSLGAMEFKLLAFFLRRQGELLTRREILSAVWGDSVHVNERTVDVHVSRLRREIALAGARIEPLYGRGYRFEVRKHD